MSDNYRACEQAIVDFEASGPYTVQNFHALAELVKENSAYSSQITANLRKAFARVYGKFGSDHLNALYILADDDYVIVEALGLSHMSGLNVALDTLNEETVTIYAEHLSRENLVKIASEPTLMQTAAQRISLVRTLRQNLLHRKKKAKQ